MLFSPLILAGLFGAVFGASHYPLGPLWIGLALAGYAVLLGFRPDSWLFAIPALLPVANLSPWSGWLHFEEFDFFVLVTVSVGYWKLMSSPPVLRLGPFAASLLGLLAASFGVSAWLGAFPLPPLDANAFSGYLGNDNAFRLLKPFVWGMLLLPLLRRSLANGGWERLFLPGMLTGLALVSAIAFWERLVFPGLMNFSSDYRITASFPEMHTGGAALDAYLSLALPFAVYAAFRGRGKLRFAAMALLIAGTYAVLVTFSRGLYLGYAASLAVFGGFALKQRGLRRRDFPLLAAYAVSALLFVRVFGTGGYRGLLAAVTLVGASLYLAGRRVPVRMLPAAGILVSALALFASFGKGAYFADGLALTVFFAAGLLGQESLAFASLPALILGNLAVDWHWGGRAALADGAIISVFAVLVVAVNRLAAKPLWSMGKEGAAVTVAIFTLLALAIPIAGNYYMKYRFHEVETDMTTRTDHWREVLGMMDRNWQTRLFGMGLGKFPQTYFWKKSGEGQPSTYRFGVDGKGAYLRLNGSEMGWNGQYLRYGQRVDIQPFRAYTVDLEARTRFPGQGVDVGLCRKLLLYVAGCVQQTLSPNADGKWHHYSIRLDSGAIGSEPWYERPTVQFYFGNGSRSGFVDLRAVSLSDGFGNLLGNGDFRKGADRWFFSSDHYHMPWHEKNLLLHVYFDQGLFGLIAFSALWGYSMFRLAAGNRVALLSAFAGFFMVGLFDSILDFPRLAFLFDFMLFVALLDAGSGNRRDRTDSERPPGRTPTRPAGVSEN